MNKYFAIGRLTAEPELRYTQTTNKACVRVILATDRGLSKEDKEAGKQSADFIPLVFWDKKAETVSKYVKKGNRIAIEGRLISGTYEKQDGSKGYTLDVHVSKLEMLESKPKDERPEPEYTEYEAKEEKTESDPFADFGQEADLTGLNSNEEEITEDMFPF